MSDTPVWRADTSHCCSGRFGRPSLYHRLRAGREPRPPVTALAPLAQAPSRQRSLYPYTLC
jgi:hypothetical protein